MKGRELCKTSNPVRLHFVLDYHDADDFEAMFLDPKLNPKCNECQSVDIDQTYKNVFGCLVCNKCKNEKTEKYSLLTKTECKEVYVKSVGGSRYFNSIFIQDYLLTDRMSHLSRKTQTSEA